MAVEKTFNAVEAIERVAGFVFENPEAFNQKIVAK